MQNKYIRAVLDNHNEFRVEVDFIVFDIMAFGIDAKLDTGCTYTFIPMKTVGGLSSNELRQQKQQDLLDNNIHKNMSRGIETGNKRIPKPKNLSEAIQEEHYIFKHTLENFYLCGISFGDIKANLSYDFNGNILIGMDIMKDWDIHIGTNKQGETVFLGCPYNMLNQEYYLSLENEFGIQQNIDAAIINNNFNNQ